MVKIPLEPSLLQDNRLICLSLSSYARCSYPLNIFTALLVSSCLLCGAQNRPPDVPPHCWVEGKNHIPCPSWGHPWDAIMLLCHEGTWLAQIHLVQQDFQGSFCNMEFHLSGRFKPLSISKLVMTEFYVLVSALLNPFPLHLQIFYYNYAYFNGECLYWVIKLNIISKIFKKLTISLKNNVLYINLNS